MALVAALDVVEKLRVYNTLKAAEAIEGMSAKAFLP